MEQRKSRNKKGTKQKYEDSKVPAVKKTPSTTPDVKKLTPKDYDYANSDKSQFAHLKQQSDKAVIPELESYLHEKVVSEQEKHNEDQKQRNKEGAKSIKQKYDDSKVPAVKKTPSTTSSIKKLTPEDYDYVNSDKSQFAHLKRETQSAAIAEQAALKSHSRNKIVSNWEEYKEISDEETPSKDFNSLLNVPISEGGHFVFKSEKNWAIEVTKFSDLFSLDVKKLAHDINCIPFTEYVRVEDKYFTADQLTKIHNLAEKSRSYIKENLTEKIVQILIENSKDNVTDNPEIIDEKEPTIETENLEASPNEEDLEEDLDFLLSLKEPIKIDQPRIAPPAYPANAEEEKNQSLSVPVKSIDLEKWLDLILDS